MGIDTNVGVLMIHSIFFDLFPQPYDHDRWLSDQAILIERIRAANNARWNEVAEIAEDFQKKKIASVIMHDIIKIRLRDKPTEVEINPEKEFLTSDVESVTL